MARNDNVARVGMIVAVLCALITTGLLVRRELFVRPASHANLDSTESLDDELWRRLVDSGRRIGPDTALFTIVEFGDFECPACRRFHESALAPLMKSAPGEVALVYHHWPLPYHRYAMLGARIAECAAAQNQFAAMLETLYRFQDSLGQADARFFAAEARIDGVDRFLRCASGSESLDAVHLGSQFAESIGASGTPTLVINGELLRYVPDSLGLAALYSAARGRP